MVENDKRTRGRPRTGRRRNRQILIRMTDEEYEDFSRIMELDGKNQADFVKAAYEMYRENVLDRQSIKKENDENVYDDYDYYDYSEDFDE